MIRRVLWISAPLLLAATVAWVAIDSRRAVGAVAAAPEGHAPALAAGVALDEAAAPARTAVLAVPEQGQASARAPAAASADDASASARGPSSPLALDIDNVASSFLGNQPAVNELFALVEDLADRAVIDADSIVVQRAPEGELLSARGDFAAGDVLGTFQIDQDGYRVSFSAAPDDPAWSRRDLVISFQDDGESGARGCHTTVQFHLPPGEPRAVPGDGVLKLVGWSLGTDELGSRARPILLLAQGGAWVTADQDEQLIQEFPWISASVGFDAWLRLLKPWGARASR